MPKHAKLAEDTLLELLRQRAERYEDKVAFAFSYEGDGVRSSEMTFGDLDTRARAIAAELQRQGARGERVLVLCRPGLDHIAGFFGCVYAGAVAVPVHERLAPRLSSVVPDARARFALGVSETQPGIKTMLDTLGEGGDLVWGLMDAVSADAEDWVAPDIDATTIAMIQYTSGSTTSPKGVVLTHENLMRNMEAIRASWNSSDSDVGAFWLPSHHDMGLIGGVLSMIYLGCTAHFMSPTAFIKRPMAWMELLSRCGATYTVAPNFAYELCIQHSTPEQRAALDLSRVRTAMNGAEPVQESTLQRFADAFAPAGFTAECFSAVYGLAEATLLVSGCHTSTPPHALHLDRESLTEGKVVESCDPACSMAVVGCGVPQAGEVEIVDPVTRMRCRQGEIGEIWCAGTSVGAGYWRRPEETDHAFRAVIADSAEGHFLRTGDLGFLHDGELFVTGRCKDLIVIRGGNHYPNDIEFTVQGCHAALSAGRGAAFAFTPGLRAEERLVIVQEVEVDQGQGNVLDKCTLDGIIEAVRTEIIEHYGLDPHSVFLVEPRSIPTTSSGKIQRGRCRELFLDDALSSVRAWQTSSAAADVARAKELEKAVAGAELVRLAVASGSAAVRQG
ncbi:fatty acyl-AMP ligase [Gordonia aichiensis]|uniref:Uncharacterized protein n=1 Tax=Gordonia aichiensis NBRC 108223 TaxID=1220583 RepID=L7KL84_9ACTN|nr:fatty acyl-AMP ligase [Gordonia aichiensis]GAC49379.1 hypothetical protein GOACH_12_00310 [Gordonia aichiensis NBRC 108223]